MRVDPHMNMDTCVMACPDCHEMKMGPLNLKAKMGKCDACGKPMKEMAMK